MNLFTREDAIILGMLFAKYFQATLFNFQDGPFLGGGSWTGGGMGWKPGGIPKYGTGRGGDMSINGDNGRPGASDDATGPADPSLAGGAGTMLGAGDGLNKGGFGYGGRANQTGGWTSSAGGGSGWFGGGSSFIDAGGGGGSNFCLSLNSQAYEMIMNVQEVYQPPDWLDFGRWVGIDTEASRNLSPWLYDLNTYHTMEYGKWENRLADGYNAYLAFRKEIDGHGCCLISNVNEYINFSTSGMFTGLAERVLYSGNVIKWVPPVEGDYHFILYGAQGGTLSYTPAGMQGLNYQQYTGGFGGYVSGVFHLSPTHKELVYNEETEEYDEIDVETALYIYVGERGRQQRRYDTWNGGGNGDGGCTSGGGATDIRWSGEEDSIDWSSTINNRFIVAGGGGGCLGAGEEGKLPEPPFTEGDTGNMGSGDEEEEGIIEIPTPGEEELLYLVNDQSVVYVQIKYNTQVILPTNRHLGIMLYINGGNEGVLYEQFDVNPKSGVVEFNFPLDQIYTPGTASHYVKLSVRIMTNIMFIIPSNGVFIKVYTRQGSNEPPYSETLPIILKIKESMRLMDKYKVVLTAPPGDLDVSTTDIFILEDEIKIKYTAVELVYKKVLDSMSLVDKVKVSFENVGPVTDIFIKKIEQMNLVDEYKLALKEIQSNIESSTEVISVVDKMKLKMISISLERLRLIENISLEDIVKVILTEVD